MNLFGRDLSPKPPRSRAVEKGPHLPTAPFAWASLLAIAIAVAGFWMARDLHDDTVRRTERNLTSLATVLAEEADSALQAIELVQDAVAAELVDGSVETEADYVRRATPRAIHDMLNTRVHALPQVNAVTLIDDKGKLLNFTRYWPIPDVDISDRDYFQALSGDPALKRFVSRPVANRGDGTWTIYIARKLTSPSGRFLGLVLGAVELRYFESLYARIAPQSDDVISLFRTDGVLIARHPSRLDTIGRTFPLAGPLQILAAEPSGSGVARAKSAIDGRDRFVATRALSHFPLVLSVSRTADSALAAWRRQAATLGVAVLLLLVGLGTMLWLGARQVRGQRRLVVSEAARIAAEEREAAERLVREGYARFATALDSMNQGLCLFDPGEGLLVLNRRFAEMYGVPEEHQRPGTSLDALLDDLRAAGTSRSGAALVGEIRAAAAAGLPAEFSYELADGRSLSLSSAPVAGGGWVCTHEDVTERRRHEAVIAHMAHHDALTDLPNRLLLAARLEELAGSAAQRPRGAMLLLDLDGFKQVNDVHGHLFGDALLRLVARRLADVVAPGDLLARLGGDEFAIVQDGASQPADAEALAARVVAGMREPFMIGDVQLAVGTSVGVAVAGEGTPELILRHADIALYRAKAAGRGRWCTYEPRMEHEIKARHDLEEDLQIALAERQFELHYQPIFETRGGALTGFEALLRWRHPSRGLVSPAEFIPICEETGLIRDLGAWVLRAACTAAAAWPEGVKIAVNLSPVQFRVLHLVAEVHAALAVSGLSPGRLELEITESVVLQEDRANLSILEDLHRLGVRIAMDDFGTGYSSLSYLRRFRFDKIKIDQQFVRGLSGEGGNLAIVRAAIGLGRALGMTVLAEGVETDGQRAILEDEGCHELQGYLLGRPMPLAAVTEVLDAAREPVAKARPAKAA